MKIADYLTTVSAAFIFASTVSDQLYQAMLPVYTMIGLML